MHLPPACNHRQLTDHHILSPLKIRHPHYPYPESLLVAFSLVDIAPNRKLADSDYQFGVHHGTVLTACQIIAGNAKQAYLSYDQLGEKPVQLPYNGILTQKTYYLQVPQGIDGGIPYAIVQDFNNWSFPQDGLPRSWKSPRRPSPTSETDCVVSSARDGDNAYFIPLGIASWFRRNGMSAYSRDPSQALGPDGSNNIGRLRSDLLKGFNRGAFVIVPKLAAGDHRLAAHYLSTGKDFSHAVNECHNRAVYLPRHIPLEYLFARFAFSVFELIRGFVTQAPRRLAVIEAVVDEFGVQSWVTKVRIHSPAMPARPLEHNALSGATKRTFGEVGMDDEDPAASRLDKRQMVQQRQPVVSSVESRVHLAAPRQTVTVQSHSLAQSIRGKVRPTEFADLPLEIRLKIWEETWPKPRVIEVDAFWDRDPEPSESEIDDIATLRFNGSISAWLQSDLGSREPSSLNPEIDSFERRPAPVALSICQESRKHTLKKFTKMLHVHEPWSFYFNPTSDILWLSSDSVDDEEDGELLWKSYGQELSKIKTAIFPIEEWREGKMPDVLRYFGGIRVIQILLEACHSDQDAAQLEDELQLQLRDDGRWRTIFQIVDRTYHVSRQFQVMGTI
ncbi:hypothetical protein B0T10DRAFT_43778 [Thelonectria olida]|uniref:2EXR domain-containing protein n=1 Tax=Thelonectria olida TaxID=1576542 RepID=A0A9P8W7C2_9HYPO|nr:hypothetical protein B0T10DRAFT_43778 [Thelonectria olida]